MKRVLVVSPHTDDGELAVGGAIAEWLARGWPVSWFTCCSRYPGQDDEQLMEEQGRSWLSLDVPAESVGMGPWETRSLPAYRQELLDRLIELRESVRPDVVFVPAAGDKHQDHQTVHTEALRAFPSSTILGYVQEWNLLRLPAAHFVEIGWPAFVAKLAALACYRSQKDRPYFDPELVLARARFWGALAGCRLAEPYEPLRGALWWC